MGGHMKVNVANMPLGPTVLVVNHQDVLSTTT
jgi:hypothetical protein